MELAYLEALKAKEYNEVPVGAIIVNDNQVISTGYNLRENENCISAHAEIIAIQKAAKKLKTWKLNDCVLYVTLEPCMMCTGAIVQSRIKQVVFGAYEQKEIALNQLIFQIPDNKMIHQPAFIGGILEERCSKLIKDYFKDKRKNKVISI
jgi:Cytosine/adenosine deaminases